MYVYCAVHLDSGRVYVGKTCDFIWRYETHHAVARKGKSKTHFHNALRKYGPEAFSWSVLERFYNDDGSAASQAEKRWIAFWQSTDPDRGFNMTLGGDGVVPSSEVREKMSRSQRLRFQTETLDERSQRIARHISGAQTIRGTKNPSAKLTSDQLEYVKRTLSFNADMETCSKLANELQVSSKTIQRIKYGITYNETSTTA